MRLAPLGLIFVARVAAAACGVPANDPGNDCDNDGCTIGQGDCDDRPDGGQFKRPSFCPNGALLEVCDGIDNNCLGGVDEGNPGGGGFCATGQTGECNRGTITCTSGMLACLGNGPHAEVCDGLDNNCDGIADNGVSPRGCFTGSPGTYNGDCADAGASCSPHLPCMLGVQSCTGGVGGTWGSCTDVRPQPERCDLVDNDCDLVVDDGDPDGGGACSTGSPGVCAAGVAHCSNGAITCTQLVDAGAEVCDGLDNDCNGTPDDLQSRFCFDGPASSYTGACPGPTCTPHGVCMRGTQACVDAGWSACNGEVLPAVEACDGNDQNCDGVIDDGNPDGGTMCSTGLMGVCSAGVSMCSSPGIVCQQITSAGAEVCDGKDNDCDGLSDNGAVDGGVACSSGLPGICGEGVTDCSDGGMRCVAATPTVEICNGLDDDCNGVDDDLADGGTVCVGPKPLRSAYGWGCSAGGAPLALLALLLLVRVRRRAMLAAVMLLSAPVSAQQLGLSFLGLKSNGVTPAEVKAVSEYVQSRLVAREGYRVTGPAEIEAIIGLERQRQLLGCDEGQSCLAEIAGALSSDRALSGQLARVGSSVLIDLSLLEPRTGKTIHRVGRRLSGSNALDDVLNAIDPMLDELIGRDVSLHPELAAQLGPAASTSARPRPEPLVVAQVGGEADLYGSAVSRSAELTPSVSVAWIPGLFGAAAAVLLNPHLGLRLEGRLTPFRELRVSPHLALGATLFVVGNVDLGLRAAVGAGTRVGPLWLSLDVAYERLLFGKYLPNAFLIGLGLGWAFR